MVPPQGLGFVLQTTSDQIDSALAEKCILGASVLFFAVYGKGSGEEGIVANPPLTSEYHGLPAGRAEGFPVKGELCLRATSFRSLSRGSPSERFSTSMT